MASPLSSPLPPPPPPDDTKQQDEDAARIEAIDTERRERRIYDYLCRLEEVRNWLVECLSLREGNVQETERSVPHAIDFERRLANGVWLAELAHFFAPQVLSLSRIYDRDQSKWAAGHRNYRYTDNLMHWRRAMQAVRLPEIFMPETADVYEGRNTQKTIFCLYALATHLYRRRLAPPLRLQIGVKFSKNQVAEASEYLADRVLPHFQNVQGMLSDAPAINSPSSPTSIDRDAAIIQQIYDAVENKDEAALLAALRAQLLFVEDDLPGRYLEELQAGESRLTKLSELQQLIDDVNERHYLQSIENVLQQQGDGGGDGAEERQRQLVEVLLRLLGGSVAPTAGALYAERLGAARRAAGMALGRSELVQVLAECNATLEVRVAAIHGNEADLVAALRDPVLELGDHVDDRRAHRYQSRLLADYAQAAPVTLVHSRADLLQLVREEADGAEDGGDTTALWRAVRRGDAERGRQLIVELGDPALVNLQYIDFYLCRVAASHGDAFDTNQLNDWLRQVNADIGQAEKQAQQLIELNATESKDENKIRALLTAIDWQNQRPHGSSVSHFRGEAVRWYAHELLSSSDSHHGEWLAHPTPHGILYLHVKDGSIQASEPPVKDKGDFARGWQQYEELFEDVNFHFDEHYTREERRLRKAQSVVRDKLKSRRANVIEEQRHKAARILQRNIRGWTQRKATARMFGDSVDGPPVTLTELRTFAPVLEDRTKDEEQEKELESLQADIAALAHSNRRYDAELRRLDEEIGLLVQNRINLEEVLAHRARLDANAAKREEAARSARQDRVRLARVAQLAFHLQTEPRRLTGLLEGAGLRPCDVDAVSAIIAPLFANALSTREQFLLVALLAHLVQRDISALQHPDEFYKTARPAGRLAAAALLRQLFLCPRLAHLLCDEPDADDISTSLLPELKQLLAAPIDVFNLNPEEIYIALHGSPAVDIHAAVADAQVEAVLEKSRLFLAHWTTRLASGLANNLRFSRAMLYLWRSTAAAWRARWPSASSDEANRAASWLVYAGCVAPTLSDGGRLAKLADDLKVDQQLAKRVDSVVRFVEFAIANKGYGNAKWYLTSLNREIHSIHEQMRAVFTRLATQTGKTTGLDEIYGLNEWTVVDLAARPTLAISARELARMHALLRAHQDKICPSPTDQLLPLIRDVVLETSEDEDKELLLFLHPLPRSEPTDEAGQLETERLLQSTKRDIVQLLLSGCKGSTLEAVVKYHSDSAQTTEIQGRVADSLKRLEELGATSSADGHRQLLDALAHDIRLSKRRRAERKERLAEARATRQSLDEQRQRLEEQEADYRLYLDTCLANMGRQPLRASIRRTGGPNNGADRNGNGGATNGYDASAEKTHDATSGQQPIQSGKKKSSSKVVHKAVSSLVKRGVIVSVDGETTGKKLSKMWVDWTHDLPTGCTTIALRESQKGAVRAEERLLFKDLLLAANTSRTSRDEQPTPEIQVGPMRLNAEHALSFVNKKFYEKN